MTVAFKRMFGILERWNNNQVTPSLSKPHELSYRSNKKKVFNDFITFFADISKIELDIKIIFILFNHLMKKCFDFKNIFCVSILNIYDNFC